MALEDVRQDIDAIDDQLDALLVRRQQLMMQAADREHHTCWRALRVTTSG